MMKKFIFCLVLIAFMQPVFAEKIPLKITPVQIISTHHNEVETGDWIRFELVQDAYSESGLFLKKGSTVIGVVDYVLENGFCRDHAEIYFKKFIVLKPNGQKLEIPYNLKLGREDYLTPLVGDWIVKHVGIAPLRGNEILIYPNTITRNIIYEK